MYTIKDLEAMLDEAKAKAGAHADAASKATKGFVADNKGAIAAVANVGMVAGGTYLTAKVAGTAAMVGGSVLATLGTVGLVAQALNYWAKSEETTKPIAVPQAQ